MLMNATSDASSTQSPIQTTCGDTLVVFVTDNGFLVPSLVAARQLVAQGIHKIADIVVYTVGVDPVHLSQLAREPALRHIRFESMAADLFAPPANSHFFENHVPATSLARLALPQVIASSVRNIVYIDGDVQVVDDVSALIKHRVPDGWIMAGRASAWLDVVVSKDTRTPVGYLEGLGGIKPEAYFNAGVLAFSLATWTAAAPQALQYFFDNSKACIRHDQSALNAVFKDRVIEFAPRYNFHSSYYDLHVQERYRPALIHFTGPQKPWGYVHGPWNSRFQGSYRRLVDEVPLLAPYLTIRDSGRLRTLMRDVKATLNERRRMRQEWNEISVRRDAFFSYVDSASFAC